MSIASNANACFIVLRLVLVWVRPNHSYLFEVWQLTDQAIAVNDLELSGQASQGLCHGRLHCCRIMQLDNVPYSCAGRPCKGTPNASPQLFVQRQYSIEKFCL